MIRLKRVYDAPSPRTGKRLLVERLWPRGVAENALPVEARLKEVGPSDAMRRWYSHDPAKWREFRQCHFAGPDANPSAWQPPLAGAGRGAVTLVYGSRGAERNNALALKAYLLQKIGDFPLA